MKKSAPLIFALIIAWVAWVRWDCIVYKLIPDPALLKTIYQQYDSDSILILFGDICSVCPSGRVIEEVSGQDHVFVFEQDAPDQDIQRFMETYHVVGTPIRDDGSIDRFISKMTRCLKLARSRNNYVITLDKNGGIAAVEKF